MTPAEREALRTLDLTCWQNTESDEGDFATIREVAEGLGVSYVWGAQLLQALAVKGYVEVRRHLRDGRRIAYAMTDAGARELADLDSLVRP